MSKEPKDATMLAARIARAYPSLSAYSSATLAESLCAIERAQRRHAERCCSGADGGYIKHDVEHGQRMAAAAGRNYSMRDCAVHDPEAERRAGERIRRKVKLWTARLGELLAYAGGGNGCTATEEERNRMAACAIELEGDPRGAVLKLRLPTDQEAVAV